MQAVHCLGMRCAAQQERRQGAGVQAGAAMLRSAAQRSREKLRGAGSPEAARTRWLGSRAFTKADIMDTHACTERRSGHSPLRPGLEWQLTQPLQSELRFGGSSSLQTPRRQAWSRVSAQAHRHLRLRTALQLHQVQPSSQQSGQVQHASRPAQPRSRAQRWCRMPPACNGSPMHAPAGRQGRTKSTSPEESPGLVGSLAMSQAKMVGSSLHAGWPARALHFGLELGVWQACWHMQRCAGRCHACALASSQARLSTQRLLGPGLCRRLGSTDSACLQVQHALSSAGSQRACTGAR